MGSRETRCERGAMFEGKTVYGRETKCVRERMYMIERMNMIERECI